MLENSGGGVTNGYLEFKFASCLEELEKWCWQVELIREHSDGLNTWREWMSTYD